MSMISYAETITSYLWTYEMIYMTLHPISYVYDCMCWNCDIIISTYTHDIVYDIIYYVSYDIIVCNMISQSKLWYHMWKYDIVEYQLSRSWWLCRDNSEL